MFVSLQALLQHAKATDSRAAQVAARDEEGRTALQIATDWRAPKAAKAILEHGPTLAERRAMWGRSDAAGAAATLLCAAFVAGYALGVTCNTMVSIVRTSFGAEEWAHAGFHAMLPALVGARLLRHPLGPPRWHGLGLQDRDVLRAGSGGDPPAAGALPIGTAVDDEAAGFPACSGATAVAAARRMERNRATRDEMAAADAIVATAVAAT